MRVVTNMHCLAIMSMEAAIVPDLGPTQYLYSRYPKARRDSPQPPKERNTERQQVRLRRTTVAVQYWLVLLLMSRGTQKNLY